jgi:hypothetical protein
VREREGERRLHEELGQGVQRDENKAECRASARAVRAGNRLPRELMDSRTAELELDERYNILILGGKASRSLFYRVERRTSPISCSGSLSRR